MAKVEYEDESIVFDEDDSDDLVDAGYGDKPPLVRARDHPCLFLK